MSTRKRELSPKEQMILSLAKEYNLPIHVIETIVLYQFDSMLEAMQIPNIKSAELTGFGRFIFLQSRANKSIVNLSKFVEEEKKLDTASAKDKVKGTTEMINLLKNKTNNYEQV